MSETNRHKVAAITGANRGLGLQLRNILLDAGYVVHGCSRSDTTESGTYPNYHHHVVDLREPEQIKRFFKEIKTISSGLDVLVNNAGIADRNLLSFVDPQRLLEVLQVNVAACLLCSKEAVRLLKKSKTARIINISSIHVPLNTPGASVYNASKAGVEQITKSLAKELANFAITVNCLGLSFVEDTGLNDETDPETRARVLANTYYAQTLKRSHLQHSLNYLLDESADCISGQVLYLGGA